MGCVYLITCVPSGKQYVGLTKHSAEVRFKGHVRDAERNKPYALHGAIRKYGQHNFKVETLATSDDREELSALEAAAIDVLNTRRPSGYNLTGGGEAPIGEHNPRFGTKHSEHTKRLMRENNAMKNPEHRSKLQGEKHPMFGKTHTEEALAKMSAEASGRVKVYDEVSDCERSIYPEDVPLYLELGYVRGRRPVTCDWRKNMGASKRGRIASKETKAKMSAAHRANAEERIGPLRKAVDELYQAGFARCDVAALLFLTPARVKALRRKRPVTIEHEDIKT